MSQFFEFFSEQIRLELLKCQCQKGLKPPTTKSQIRAELLKSWSTQRGSGKEIEELIVDDS